MLSFVGIRHWKLGDSKMRSYEQVPEHKVSAEYEFICQEERTREAQAYNEREARIIDYTPINERDSPCLNGCMTHGIYGCMAYGGHISDMMKKCEKYKDWRIRKFGETND